MAKFKEGDRITDGNAVYEVTDVDDGIYEWKVISGKADPSHSEGGEIAWAEGKMRLANSRACNSRNPVVAKAMNAVATNVKSYPFYVVDKAMKGKCIFSGRYELSDANDDVAELKKSGIESKAVSRRVLLMSGIDPDEESSWKKNHRKD